MCGLVGAFSFAGSEFCISDEYITRMRDTMAHRGPDGAGTWVSADGRIGLGHRRLSIIDLSSNANQPMEHANGRFQLVFNGEIYNHAEIREELISLGDREWQTDHSDTEVILHAFERWGIDCLDRLRGMFALALWDAHQRELWLVRDRIGIKPLYYSIHHGRIVFASEIKALLSDPDQQREVDEQALFHYLSFLTTPGPETLFDGIRKLPPATWLRINAEGDIRQHRYWDLWDHSEPLDSQSDEEIAERLLEELRTTVTLRKVGDVPVGVFLSGGIDSSTNAALFSEGDSQRVKTFSIGYDGEYDTYQNELHHARFMANRVDAKYHEMLLSVDDLIEFLPTMIDLQDEPIADPVCVPVYYVSKLARANGVTVCQVGEGADELFCGYDAWKHALNAQHWDDLPVPRVVKQMGMSALSAVGRDQGIRYEWLRRSALGQPVFWGGAEAFTQLQKQRLLSPRLGRQFRDMTSWDVLRPLHDRFRQSAWAKSHLHWMTYVDLNIRLPELLLMRVDKMSMGVSLECRVPFLDHKFVELAMSIPENVKTRNGTTKYILKKAVRNVIPDKLIDRRKQGFGVPVYEWLFGRLGDYARHELAEFCDRTDYLNYSEVERLMNLQLGAPVWYLFNFALWWKRYIAQESINHEHFTPIRRSA